MTITIADDVPKGVSNDSMLACLAVGMLLNIRQLADDTRGRWRRGEAWLRSAPPHLSNGPPTCRWLGGFLGKVEAARRKV